MDDKNSNSSLPQGYNVILILKLIDVMRPNDTSVSGREHRK